MDSVTFFELLYKSIDEKTNYFEALISRNAIEYARTDDKGAQALVKQYLAEHKTWEEFRHMVTELKGRCSRNTGFAQTPLKKDSK